MIAIDVEAFQMRTQVAEGITYTVLLTEGADGDLISMTFHPYQVEKLHRAISSPSKELTAGSDALSAFDRNAAKLLREAREIATAEDLLAVFTSGGWEGHRFIYKVITHGEEFKLTFEGASAARLFENLEGIIDLIRAQRRN